MVCHEFKGGIGISSRVAGTSSGEYIVGALVQADYGLRHLLRVDGVSVGRQIDGVHTLLPWDSPCSAGSIIVVATDAPLLPVQCKRLARRATVGHNGSGDIFLAFSTGNQVPSGGAGVLDIRMLPNGQIDPLFDAVAEAVEASFRGCFQGESRLGGDQGGEHRS